MVKKVTISKRLLTIYPGLQCSGCDEEFEEGDKAWKSRSNYTQNTSGKSSGIKYYHRDCLFAEAKEAESCG